MNLFVQGMRRSGTTIVYDALLEDPELDCQYEPLREQGVTMGGGSGARETDAFAHTRALRDEFRRSHYPDLDPEEFNWGGPRLPDVELDAELPEHVSGFLRFLVDRAPRPHVMVKETRLYRKVPAVHALDPAAVFVHVVRDPRAVAASIVLGRGRRQLRKIRSEDAFFEYRSDRKLWSSRRISELLVGQPGFEGAGEDPGDVMRVLMVWKATFAEARREALRLYGERYVPLRNEDLRSDPAAALAPVYAVLGRDLPDSVAAWARDGVRPPEEVYAGEDRRWLELLERLDLQPELSAAGYAVESTS
jgi:hypothetical protein